MRTSWVNFLSHGSLWFCHLGLAQVASAQPSVDRSFNRLDNPTKSIKIYNTQVVTTPLTDPKLIPGQSVLPPGFEMQLVASEPDVQQPIALSWDAKGRLWVVENYTFAGKQVGVDTKLTDRIIILEDTDQDGTFDKRKVFWDQGKKLTSIEIGKNGVWALAPPNLLFLSDANQDDLCDGKPIIVLNGFDDKMPSEMANGLRFGPDGWLYGRQGALAISDVGCPIAFEAQSKSKAQLRYLDQTERPKLFSENQVKSSNERTRVSAGIWRFNTKTSEFQVVCSGTTNPSGMDWDRYGNLFVVNSELGRLWHAIPNSSLQRKLGLDADSAPFPLLTQISEDLHGNTKGSQIGDETNKDGGGRAHCGMMIYQADQWPLECRNEVFTLNVSGKKMDQENLVRQGAGFVGKHPSELVQWRDAWFRGIELSYGPDGTVYVLDWSDLSEGNQEMGVHRTSGRIYRISYRAPTSTKVIVKSNERTTPMNVSTLETDELLKLLKHTNAWYARMAQRIIAGGRRLTSEQVESLHKDLFAKSFEASQVETTVLRLRALWTLNDSDRLDKRTVVRLIRNNEPEEIHAATMKLVADQGLEALEPDETEVYEEILETLSTMVANKTGSLVRLYLAALQPQFIPSDWRLPTLLAQSSDLANDRDFPIVLWHGMKSRVALDAMGAAKLCGKSKIPKLTQLIVRRLAELHVREPEALDWVVGDATIRGAADYFAIVVAGMSEGYAGFASAPTPKTWDKLLRKMEPKADELTRQRIEMLQIAFGIKTDLSKLLSTANDPKTEVNLRRFAVQKIAEIGTAEAVLALWQMLTDEDIAQVAALAIANKSPAGDAANLVNFYRDAAPNLRRGIVAALASKSELMVVLLDAAESNKIPVESIDAASWRQFQVIGDWPLLERARKLNPNLYDLSEDSRKAIDDIKEELTDAALLSANASRGRLVWEAKCASCHKLFGEGQSIGPDLTGEQRINKLYWLENILAPSAQVAAKNCFEIFEMQDGSSINGVPLAETNETITIQTINETVTVQTLQVTARKTTDRSLMPEGLLDSLSTDSRLDLFRYLMSPNQVPLPATQKTRKP